MLYTTAVALIILWLLGLAFYQPINGIVHILVVIAVILMLVRIVVENKLKP